MKRLLFATAAVVAVLAMPEAAAAEFDTCSFDAGTHTVTATLSTSTTGGVFVGAGGAITSGTPGGGSNFACGTATTANTDTINLSGDPSLDVITIDTSAGPFAPGFTDEPDLTDEIEINVDLGPPPTGDLQRVERLRIIGSGNDDNFRLRCEANSVCGETWINLNNAADADDHDLVIAHPPGVNSDQRLLELRMGAGTDTVTGTANPNTISGLGNSQNVDRPLLMSGGDGNDNLVGGSREDAFRGDDGNDTLDAAKGGVGVFATGSVDYSDATGSVTVTDVSDVSIAKTILVNDGFGETDTLKRIGNIIGSPQADNLKLPAAPSGHGILNGGGGEDTITGSDGPDLITGGEGNDTIDAKGGFAVASTAGYYSNAVDGGPGNDTITDGDGPGVLDGGTGDDTITAGPGQVTFQCDVFSSAQCVAIDQLKGSAGNDTLTGGADSDLYVLADDAPSAETDTITELPGGGTGDGMSFGFNSLIPASVDLSSTTTAIATKGSRTVVTAGAGQAANIENVQGTRANDTVQGNAAVNKIETYSGVDTINSADSVADTLDCGPEIDLPTFDTLDSLKDCDETSTGTPPTTGGGAGGDTAPGGSTGGGDTTPAGATGGGDTTPGGGAGGSGGGGGGSGVPAPNTPSDPTRDVPNACLELAAGNRTRSKAAPGGGSLVLQISQSEDSLKPLKAKIAGKGKAKIKSVTFNVNGTAVTATGKAADLPIAALKIGKRNKISATVTLTSGKKVVVSDIVTPRKCTLPPITCKRLDAGARIECTSSLPKAASRVKVSVTGQPGESATGTAKPKKGARSSTYSLTMRPSRALAPGKYVYKHVVTLSGKKQPKLLVVRVITLE